MKFALRRPDIESVGRELQQGLSALTMKDNVDKERFLEKVKWSPIITPGGTLALSNVRISRAFYVEIGKLVFVDAEIYYNIVSGSGNQINISLPLKPLHALTVLPVSILDTGSIPVMGYASLYLENGGYATVRRYDAANLASGNNKVICITGTYWRQ